MSEVQSEGGMTFAEAKSAIESAGQADQAQEAADAAIVQQGGVPGADQATEPTPGETPDPGATEFASTEAVEDSFMGQDFNPDLLPPELQQGFKQLQGSYTRKTQELAEQRKALEELGDPEALKQAAEFYQSLQDPEYLKSFYNELGGVVKELGLVEEPAAPEGATPEAAPEPPVDLTSLGDDPELAPLVERLKAMDAELASFREQQAAERQSLEEERQLMAEAAEIERMAGVVREQHPEYGDEDWEAIYDRAVAFDGDVLKAADLYEADKARIIQSWTNQKTTPQSVTPTKGAAVVSESTDEEGMTLDQAQKAAEAYLNANDLQEFVG